MAYDRLKTLLAEGRGPLLQLDLLPEEPNELVTRAQYPGQRPVSSGSLANLSSLMRKHRWVPLGLLSVAEEKGRLFLVDGQHRLKAHASLRDVEPPPRIVWAVRFLDGSPDDVYALLDAVARARPHHVRLAAMGVPLAGRILRLASPAAAFVIQSAPARASGAGPPLITERDDFVLAHADELRRVDELIQQIGDEFWAQLYNPPVVALFFATLQVQGEEALDFCLRVFRAGTGPFRTVANHVTRPRPEKAPLNYYARLLALCWNSEHGGSSKLDSHAFKFKQWHHLRVLGVPLLLRGQKGPPTEVPSSSAVSV